MKIFARIWIVSLIILLLSPLNSFAGRLMDSTYIDEDTANAVSSSKEIYGYTGIATTDACVIAFYDSATLGGATNSKIVSELAEATSGNSQTIWFPKPKVCANACTVIITNGAAIIYHSK